MKQPKVILWDIEATNLSANFGYVLCVGWKELGKKKTNLIKISDFKLFTNDPTNDSEVIRETVKVLTGADAWVTWYGRKFDEPFINTRALFHKLPLLPPMAAAHIDGWRIAKYKMKLNSNRLDTVSKFCGVAEKTPLDGPTWIDAAAGKPKALKYVYDHCRQDVVVLEEVYNKIKILGHGVNLATFRDKVDPNKQVCPVCNKENMLTKQGTRLANATKKQRYHCTNCGAWSTGKVESVPGLVVR